MRKEIELLEDHADVAAHLVDLLQVARQLDAVDDDAALLVLLQPVDAADERRLAGARRPADHDPLAARHPQVDVAQDVELAEPFVDALHVDVKHRLDLVLSNVRALVNDGCRAISARSRCWLYLRHARSRTRSRRRRRRDRPRRRSPPTWRSTMTALAAPSRSNSPMTIDERRVLEERDERVDERRNRDAQRLRQHDQHRRRPEAQPDAGRRLVLSLGDRLQPGANHFGQ